MLTSYQVRVTNNRFIFLNYTVSFFFKGYVYELDLFHTSPLPKNQQVYNRSTPETGSA